MTSGVTITDGTNTVDFNTAATKACNVTVSHRFSNPILTVDTPILTTQKLGENTLPINIGFVVNAYDLTFDLYDGPGTFNFITPSTDYEKIMYMANYVRGVKTMSMNGTTFTGMIENVNIEWKGGKMNISEGCTLTFHLAKDIGQ
jgi:hypothetical protein